MSVIKRKNYFALLAGRLSIAWLAFLFLPEEILAQQTDTTGINRSTTQPYQPSRRPVFRPADRYGDPFSATPYESPLFLKDPGQMQMDVEIDTGFNYTIYERMGDVDYRPASTLTFEEFKQYQERQMLKDYWKSRTKALDGESAVSGRGFVPKIFVSPVLDRIFGGSYVELVPRGFVTLDFGGQWQKINNPSVPIRQQRNGGFEFDQQINMNVVGKVGEKLAVTANFDNNNSFDFQNNMKVEYTGFKEDILQKLEIGNVSLPLNNTLIQGAQNLFGVKAQLQFGKLNVTTIASTQRGKVSSIDIGGGDKGQGRPFEIIASNYDENRHFFLGHFFRDNYRRWIQNLPQITSGVNVTRVEVYILNRNNDTQTLRNVVGLMDLGEGRRVYNSSVQGRNPNLPNANQANDLFASVQAVTRNPDNINQALDNLFAGESNNGTDYEKITGARKLAPTEYSIHQQLGYITLTRKLQNDEALVVAYEYTYNGQVYRVGELSEDYATLRDEEVIFLKMLRPRKVSIRDAQKALIPTWDLMMKNIYSLNVNQLQQENFELRIIYRDDRTGIDNPQLQEGVKVRNRQLIEILGLDKLNPVNDRQRDGNFDYVEGITINSQNGLIIFPYLEPFSEALREAFRLEENPTLENRLIEKYSYDTLYNTTKADAELFATKNKFWIVGTYSASSSREILIPGFGVTPGSVKVFAGGIALQENSQFSVDYTFGKVTILDESILSSGKNISVQYEQADPFAFQTRTLIGTRLDYKVSDEVNLGSTILYYNERPLVSRNLIGSEPARNLMYGFDFNINKTSRVLTKMVDAIPILQTKEPSAINFSGEFAQLVPGTSNVIDGEGTAYVDDFENTATPYSLMGWAGWKLSSIPQIENDPRFPSPSDKSLAAGYGRAKIAWYQVDNLFYRNGGRFKPSNIPDDIPNHYVRAVRPDEIFPNRQLQQGVFYEPIFDIAYYPAERGPHNYNPSLTTNGLPDPQNNWAGITNAIRTEVDFDKANIEYIEFWLLDPFLSGTNGLIDDGVNPPQSNTTGGELIFHLGSISEDVMRDSKHAFENGLPPDGNKATVTQTSWGYVTNQQYLTNAFDNSPSSRANQDVGLDGATDGEEGALFLSNVASPQLFQPDPSADNFQYFLDGIFDERSAGILERYKNYNNMEGNTPVSGNDPVARSGSPYPDNEDLNADNTLSELEEYYAYNISLRPGQLEVGNGYIVDKIVTNNNPANENVTWYLFRIPVRDVDQSRIYGNISGFKSIRYMRTVLTGFSQPVVLRFANFRMVASRWRRYAGELRSGLDQSPENPLENFSVSVVNLEDNGEANLENNKSPYRIPPGVLRDRDNTSTVPRQLNEQAVQFCVDNLEDGDSRAIYKNVEADFFNYGRLKMFLHADSESEDDQLYAFVRLGSDFDQNYYEVEIPLKISRVTNAQNPDVREIWPEENEIDLDLNALYALKAARDREGFPLDEPYPGGVGRQEGRHLIRIFGRPDLSSVRLMMIGVRNPRSEDRRTHSACVWANELRLTEFNRTAGWAVNTALNAKLADFATVTGALRYTTFGFGSVSSKIGERTRDETTSYDVTASINVDKLLPGNTGIKIPMFVGYENTTINPQYDPANPDLRLQAALNSFSDDAESSAEEKRENYLDLIRDQSERRSLNFTNVRKEKVKPDAKKHIYDIENFAFSYSFSEAKRSSFNIKESLQQQYGGSVAYNYAPQATGIEPFKNSEGLKSPYLKLIKDFNFGIMPSNISVRGDLERSFSKEVYRNDQGIGEIENFQKYFVFNRNYNVRWALSKGLTLDYTARANAIIDEPEGQIDTQEERDSIMNNLKRFGRIKNFDQTVTANYTIPLDKIPLTDWVNAEYRYQVNYNWKAGPANRPDGPNGPEGQDLADSLDFRNTVQNSREQNITGRLDMVKLYNKVKFLKEINTPPKPVRPATTRPGARPPQQPAKADTTQKASMPKPLKGLFRLLMSLRSVNGTYTKTEGTILPGFNPSPWLFGMDKDFSAPGWPFVLGSQDPNIRYKAASSNWLVQREGLTMPFAQVQTTAISLRASIEPTTDLKIQLDVKKDASSSYQEIFRYNGGDYESLNPSRGGSYKVSTIAIRSAFIGDNDDVESSVFREFEENLSIVKQRFETVNNFVPEYDTTQDILIPAFIAAYTGQDPYGVSLSPFPARPLPNWRVDYTGLSKVKSLSKIFQSVTVSHAYSSFYSVVNYSNSLQYESSDFVGIDVPIEDYNRSVFSNRTNDQGQPVPIYVISQVLISEQFAPLIGINVRTKSRVTAKVEYKTKRDLSLNISNAQVTEQNNKDVAFEVGFTKNNMKLPFKSQGRTIVLKNDVTFRMNFTISDSKTIQRKINELNIITNGNVNLQLRPNISYAVNQKLNIQLYFERTINDPLISSSYRRSTTRFGTQIRFNLAQ